jgi:hypothetical protein
MRIWTNYIKRVKFWLEGGQASSLPPLFDFGTLFSFHAMGPLIAYASHPTRSTVVFKLTQAGNTFSAALKQPYL